MAALAAATCLATFVLPLPYDQNLAVIINKRDRLRNMPGERLIFVGGSGLFGGLDVRRLEAELKKPVANLGFFAGFGIFHLLDEVTPFLRPGDTVLIVPEYGLIRQDFQNNEQSRKWILRLSPGRHALQLYPPSKDGLVNFVQDSGALLLSQLATLRKAVETLFKRDTRFYTPRGFVKYRLITDETGEPTEHHRFAVVPADQVAGKGDTYPDLTVKPESMALLNNFGEAAARRGARVLFVFAAFPREEYELNKAAIDRLHRQLKNELRFDIVGQPEDFIYPGPLFANSIDHLNADGVRERTDKLLALLRPHLQNK